MVGSSKSQNGRASTVEPGPAGLLRMKQLEQATGVGREAIRFYIRAGLLPEPQRLGRNVALYDAAFIDRIRLIKELQQKRFLPLRVIKAIVDGDTALAPAEAQTLADIDPRLFRAAGIETLRPPVRLAEVVRRTGVSAADIRRLTRTGAVEISTRKGTLWLADLDARIVELWGKLRDAGFNEALGFKPEDTRLYVDMVRWLAREEVRVFTRGVTGKADPQQFTAMAEAGVEILNQLLGLLRTNELLRYIERGDVSPAARKPAPQKADGTRRPRSPQPVAGGTAWS